MGSFLPNSEQEQLQMLNEIGFNSFEELFGHIPEQVLLKNLNLAEGMSELQAMDHMEELADKNVKFRHIFRGAGAYNHYITAIVGSVVNKEHFVTAYTP